jgi:membrane-bound lytic murein transglycosylase MltF
MLFNCRITRCGKKKDELGTTLQIEATPTTQTTPTAKFSAIPTIQTSNKPVVGFNDLKIKSQFLLQENQQQYQTNGSTSETTPVASEPTFVDEVLTLEKIKAGITSYANEKAKTGNKQLYATLISSNISFTGAHSIEIELNNEVQREMLINVKQDMLDDLRNRLKNKQTQLEIKVSATQQEVKAYKPIDKFKMMAEKNPSLLELKKRFDLDIEY